MSEVFEVCETNFYKSIRQAQKILKNQETSIIQLAEASEHLTQATQQLNKMEIEYSLNRDPLIKNKIDLFKDQLRNYKREHSKKQQILRQIHNQQNSGPLFQVENQKGTDALLEAKRQMYENQAISNQVALNLRKNNETLIKNVNRMGDINNELTVAHKLVNSIKNKLRKNKFVMWGTFAFLFIVLALIVYTYFRDQNISPGPTPSIPTIPTQPSNNLKP